LFCSDDTAFRSLWTKHGILLPQERHSAPAKHGILLPQERHSAPAGTAFCSRKDGILLPMRNFKTLKTLTLTTTYEQHKKTLIFL
jgi:hypothetical protein